MDSDRKRDQLLIQEQETHIETSMEADKRASLVNIRTTSQRFLMLAIFGLAAFSMNAAERVKLWFRDEVRTRVLWSSIEKRRLHLLGLLRQCHILPHVPSGNLNNRAFRDESGPCFRGVAIIHRLMDSSNGRFNWGENIRVADDWCRLPLGYQLYHQVHSLMVPLPRAFLCYLSCHPDWHVWLRLGWRICVHLRH